MSAENSKTELDFKRAAYLTLIVAAMTLAAMLYKAATTDAIYIEINSSAAFSANRLGNIVDCIGYDDEARELLSSLDTDGKDYARAVSDALDRLKRGGKITERDKIYFELDAEKGASREEKLEAVRNRLKEVCADYKLNAVFRETDEGIIQTAQSYGISVARYRLICEMQKTDPSISVDVYKDYSLKTLRQLYSRLISGNSREDAERESGARRHAVKEKIDEIISESEKE